MPDGWLSSAPESGWKRSWAKDDSILAFSGYAGSVRGATHWGQAPCASGFNCTAYAAYRLKMNGAYDFVTGCKTGSNAESWDERARKCGIPVNNTPAPGAILQWDVSSENPAGHVAYVDAVYGASILISEAGCRGGASRRVVTLTGLGVGTGSVEFIHALDLPNPGANPGAGDPPPPPPLPVYGATATVDRREIASYLYRLAGAPKLSTTTNPYADVSSIDPYYKAMLWMSEKKISRLGDGTTFQPSGAVSREAFAAFLYRTAGSTYVGPSTSPFSDVSTSNPFYDAIAWLKAKGISTGYSDGTFHPSEALTRSAAAILLHRYAGSPAVTKPAESPYSDVPTTSDAYVPVLWMTQGHVAVDRFSDVPMTHGSYSEIAWLARRGITAGNADGTFRPSDGLDRQSAAAFLYRLAGSPSVTLPSTSPFSDVPASHPFYKPIVWMWQKKITTGNSNGTFGPTDDVSRQAVAAFLYRYSGSPAFTPPTTSPFTDVTPGDPFYREITWLKAKGITSGWADGTFRPAAPVARDAMAVFLYRIAAS